MKPKRSQALDHILAGTLSDIIKLKPNLVPIKILLWLSSKKPLRPKNTSSPTPVPPLKSRKRVVARSSLDFDHVPRYPSLLVTIETQIPPTERRVLLHAPHQPDHGAEVEANRWRHLLLSVEDQILDDEALAEDVSHRQLRRTPDRTVLLASLPQNQVRDVPVVEG